MIRVTLKERRMRVKAEDLKRNEPDYFPRVFGEYTTARYEAGSTADLLPDRIEHDWARLPADKRSELPNPPKKT